MDQNLFFMSKIGPNFFLLVGIISLVLGQGVGSAQVAASPASDLFQAAKNGDLDQVKTLIAQGVPVDAPMPKGATALIAAATGGPGCAAIFDG